MDVELVVGDAQVQHRHHRHHGEGFVDLEQIHVVHAPAHFLEQLLGGADRGHGELAGMAAVGGVAENPRQRLQAALLRHAFAGQHQRRGAVGDRAGVGGGDRAVLLERRLEAGDLVDIGVAGLLVGVHHGLAFAGFHRHRHDLVGEPAVVDGGLGALEGFDGEVIHLLAADAALVRHVLGEGAHQAAGFRVFQAVQEHVIRHLAVAHAVAAPRLIENVGRVAHGLHAAADHDVVAAGFEHVVAEHGGAHARAAQFVDGGGAGTVRQAGQTHGLAGRALLEAGGQHAAHHHVLDVLRLQPGAGHRFADTGAAQLRRAHRRQRTLETAHGGARTVEDNDIVFGHADAPLSEVSGILPGASLPFAGKARSYSCKKTGVVYLRSPGSSPSGRVQRTRTFRKSNHSQQAVGKGKRRLLGGSPKGCLL